MARNVVATSQPLAAQAGLRMLLNGGNAIDAALATAIALTVLEPTSNGIGSDAFALVWDGAQLHGLNASGRSPSGWTSERFAGMALMPERGWDTVTVPGAVSAWCSLSERFGSLPFEDLFVPAIDYANDGFEVGPIVARSWQRAAEMLCDFDEFRRVFMPFGAAPKAGETFRSVEMARTLQEIATTKGKSFYEGDLARRISESSIASGGCLGIDDLASHRPDWVEPISMSFAGYQIHEIPPNGQGIAALMALGILRNIRRFDQMDPDSADAVHVQVEAMKLAFADLHRYVSDPETMDVQVSDLLDDDYLSLRAKSLHLQKATQPTIGIPGKSGTVYLSAADSAGGMVSFIQSNYMGFGSGIVVPGTGISLQNRGNCFRSQAGHPNSVGPGKRPFHTIIPGFVTQDGKPFMSFGVMGGAMQAQGHVQMCVRILVHGQNPQQSSDAPRWQVLDSGDVSVESTMDPKVVDELRSKGHQVVVEDGRTNQSFGGAQLIVKLGAGYVAGSDHRKDGLAVGY